MTKVAVIGVGHLGKHHARIYKEMPDVELVASVDVIPERGTLTDYTQLFGKVDAVSLAVPTVDHARIGKDLLEHGIDVLVEKPIAFSVEEARVLIDTAAKHGRILQVGHVERFNPVVVAAHEVATTPQFFEIHRLASFSSRS